MDESLDKKEGQLYTYIYYKYDGYFLDKFSQHKEKRYVKVWPREKHKIRRKHYDHNKKFLFEDYLTIPGQWT